MEIKNAEFIKVGNNILPKPKGADYELINGGVYDLKWDRFEGRAIFTENGKLNLPDKVYELEEDTTFKTRVLNNFNKNDKSVGIMLAGTKGTGKTMLAKVIAKESNLPIIIVDSQYPANRLVTFFKQFTTPVCIIFDEIEKNFDTSSMLDFLDGVEKTTKKLVLMTCNNLNRVSEYLQDRCSRVRYIRKYTPTDNLAFLPMLIEDKQIKNAKEVEEFIKTKFKLPSIDNINAFLNEIKELEDEDLSLDDIIKYMNINLNDSSTPNITPDTDSISIAIDEDDLDDLLMEAA
jgi:SpoVK/Ycf46/Vps4 family AAA+-type ATPase